MCKKTFPNTSFVLEIHFGLELYKNTFIHFFSQQTQQNFFLANNIILILWMKNNKNKIKFHQKNIR